MGPYCTQYKGIVCFFLKLTAQMPNQDVSSNEQTHTSWWCPDKKFGSAYTHFWPCDGHYKTYYASSCLLHTQSVHNRTQILCLDQRHTRGEKKKKQKTILLYCLQYKDPLLIHHPLLMVSTLYKFGREQFLRFDNFRT